MILTIVAQFQTEEFSKKSYLLSEYVYIYIIQYVYILYMCNKPVVPHEKNIYVYIILVCAVELNVATWYILVFY